MLHVVAWLWGDKYRGGYTTRLHRGLQRGFRSTEYQFRVIGPLAEDMALTAIPGCLCRLRMFDQHWQKLNGIKSGEQIVCLDLDLIVTGELDHVFKRGEDFVILAGANAANPCPYNGSVMMLRAGTHADVWRDFSLEAVRRVPRYEFPDDQGWLWAKVPDAGRWQVGRSSGIYAFRKPGWPQDDMLPADARIVAFPGRRDPSQFMQLEWIKKHWQ